MLGSPLNLPSLCVPRDRSTWPTNATIRSHFGQDVLWHSVDTGGRHLEASQLEPYRQIGDPAVDEIFQLLDEQGQALSAGQDVLQAAADAYQQEPESRSPAQVAMADFYQRYSQVPSWVDWESVQAGQRVFLAYMPAIGYTLYYRSLVPGFSIPKIAAVLLQTAYLAPPSTEQRVHQRLMDTGGFLALCTARSIGDTAAAAALEPNGDAWKAALHVRFLHAKVRRALLQRKGARAWKTAELGVPINQEDMAATLLAFCTNSLWGVEHIAGRPLPEHERRDYTHFWRYVGWLLGVETYDDIGSSGRRGANNGLQSQLRPLDPCGPGWIVKQPDSIAHSNAVFQSIIYHLMYPDESSVRISHFLLHVGRRDALEQEPGTTKKKTASDDAVDHIFYFRALQCRRLIGDPLADALQLPLNPIWYRRQWQRFKSTVILAILRVYSLAALPGSPLRRFIVQYHASNMDRFVQFWRDSHTDTMTLELQKQGVEQSNGGGACPFAMVAPPQS